MRRQDQRLIDTLKLSERDKHRLVKVVDEQGRQVSPLQEQERRDLRVSYQGRGVKVTLTVAGPEVVYSVLPRNLSRNGMAFLHGRFVHNQTPCQVAMPTLCGRTELRDAQVVRCRHIAGIVHEVSLKFAHPINVNDITDLTPEQVQLHEQERSASEIDQPYRSDENARGRVLIVDGCLADRRLFNHWLRQIGLVVKEVPDGMSALVEINTQKFDMVVTDVNLGTGPSGIELIPQLRAAGFKGPIVASSVDHTEIAGNDAKRAGASAFISKPLDPGRLTDTVVKLLGLCDEAKDEKPIVSSMSDDRSMRPLLREYVMGLSEYVAQLRTARATEDHDEMRTICHQLRGSGGGYGFKEISLAADVAMAALEADQQDVEAVHKQINALIRTLQRVQFA